MSQVDYIVIHYTIIMVILLVIPESYQSIVVEYKSVHVLIHLWPYFSILI